MGDVENAVRQRIIFKKKEKRKKEYGMAGNAKSTIIPRVIKEIPCCDE